MKKTILSLASILLVGCAVKLVPPTQSDVDRVQTKFPNYSLSELNQGKDMFEKKCTVCHGLKNPTKFPEEKWNKIVPSMAKKANNKHPNTIDAQTQDLILKYLVTMSGAPKK